MYIGMSSCLMQHFYDFFYMVDFIRISTVEKELSVVYLQPEAITSLLTSYIGISFSVLSHSSVVDQSAEFLADTRSKERTKLIKQNLPSLELLVSYCKKTLSMYQGLEDTEKEIMRFKRNCEFGENADLFVYEFDISEISHFLASRTNSYASEYANNLLDLFTIPRINMTLMNFFVQLFLQIDILWRISDDRLRDISKLQISHFQDKNAIKHVSKNSLFVFISITFKSSQTSL